MKRKTSPFAKPNVVSVFRNTAVFLFLFAGFIFGQFLNVRIDDPLTVESPNEVTIAINPKNPDIIAAASNLYYFYISTDGGKSWNSKSISSTFGVWGDPSVIFDDNGFAYFAHLSNPRKNGYWIDRIVVQRSTDNGQTFNNGAGIGFNSPKNQDKEWLACDLTNSPFHGNIYVTWTEFDDYGSHSQSDSSRILFSRSTDAGLSWSRPIKVSDKSGNCIDGDQTAEGAVPAVGPNGEIYVAWARNDSIFFDKSTDGGNSFGKDIFVTEQPGGWDFDIQGIDRCNGLPVTACDVSHSPFRGNIYVLWGDKRNGNADVFLIKSTNGGNSWGNPVKVNNDHSDRDQFLPWMAVDSSNGNIYAIFYDRRNTSGVATEVYLACSTDGGETFENFKISESPFSPTSRVFFGDYTNIAAYKGKIRPVWMRLENSQLSVWTALIDEDSLLNKVSNENLTASNFSLGQNYPNPANPTTVIPFTLKKGSNIELSVFNVLGQKVEVLYKGFETTGKHEIEFNASQFATGIYFYRLTSGVNFLVRKMTILK